MVFVIPPKSEVGVLSPEIAGEGQRVIQSDGNVVNFTPPPVKALVPDMSEVKAIKHYFVPRNYRPWPAWLYHPTEEPRLVKDAHEAAALGVCYRDATLEEKGRYGSSQVWDWKDDCQWRPTPLVAPKFDPANPGTGKTYIPPSGPNNDMAATVALAVTNALKANAQGPDMVSSVAAAVAAAVAEALKANAGAAEAKDEPASEILSNALGLKSDHGKRRA